jgi:hypothetical protein
MSRGRPAARRRKAGNAFESDGCCRASDPPPSGRYSSVCSFAHSMLILSEKSHVRLTPSMTYEVLAHVAMIDRLVRVIAA